MQSIIQGIKKRSSVFGLDVSLGRAMLSQIAPENGQPILAIGASLLDSMKEIKRDFNIRVCLFLREKLEEKADIELMYGKFNDIPWKSSCFGSIIVSEIYQLDDINSLCMSELKRVLIPGGQILIKLNISFISLMGLMLNRNSLKKLLQSMLKYGFESSSLRFSELFEAYILIR